MQYRQPKVGPARARKGIGLTHLWATNTYGPTGIPDLYGRADGVFGVAVSGPNPSGTQWELSGDAYRLNWQASGTGTGSGDIALGDSNGSGSPGSQTFTAVFRVSTSTTNQTHTVYGGPISGVQIRWSNLKFELLKSNVASIGTNSTSVAANTEVDVAISYDGTTARFYINGAADGTGSSAQTFTLSGQYWLFAAANGERSFDGDRICRLALFDKVLPPEQIKSLVGNGFWQLLEDEDPIYPQAAGTVALSGVAGTWSAGNVTPSGAVSLALSGVQGSWSAGTVGVQVDGTRALSGVVGTWAAGNVTPSGSSSLALSGVVGTWNAGNVAGSTATSIALTGVFGTWSAGDVTPVTGSVLALSGVVGTWSPGNVTGSTATSAALTGVQGTWAAGNLTPSSGSTLALSGVAGTWQAGTVVPSVANVAALTGVQGNWNAGSLVVGGDKQAALTGVEGTWSAGNLTVEPQRPVNIGGWIDWPKKKQTKKETQPKEKAVEKDNLRELIVEALQSKAAPAQVKPAAVLAALPARVPKVQQKLKAEVAAVVDDLIEEEEELLLLLLL